MVIANEDRVSNLCDTLRISHPEAYRSTGEKLECFWPKEDRKFLWDGKTVWWLTHGGLPMSKKEWIKPLQYLGGIDGV